MQKRMDLERWKLERGEGQTVINAGAVIPRLKKGQCDLSKLGSSHTSLQPPHLPPHLLYEPQSLPILGLSFRHCLRPCGPRWWQYRRGVFATLTNQRLPVGRLHLVGVFCISVGNSLFFFFLFMTSGELAGPSTRSHMESRSLS